MTFALVASVAMILLGCWWLWLSNSWQLYQEAFARYGTFIDGVLGVILSTINVYFLLYIWREQSNVFMKDSVEKRYFELLKIRLQLRDEVRVKQPAKQSIDYEHFWEGNTAIHHIALELDQANRISAPDKRSSERERIYMEHSDYLRHFFDFSLHVMEYIDKQPNLTSADKQDYIDILVESSSYDENLIWLLVETDYDRTVRPGQTQHQRLQSLNEKYGILRRLVLIMQV